MTDADDDMHLVNQTTKLQHSTAETEQQRVSKTVTDDSANIEKALLSCVSKVVNIVLVFSEV
jgi:hypothetical protein